MVAGILGLGALYFAVLCNGLSFENHPPKVGGGGGLHTGKHALGSGLPLRSALARLEPPHTHAACCFHAAALHPSLVCAVHCHDSGAGGADDASGCRLRTVGWGGLDCMLMLAVIAGWHAGRRCALRPPALLPNFTSGGRGRYPALRQALPCPWPSLAALRQPTGPNLMVLPHPHPAQLRPAQCLLLGGLMPHHVHSGAPWLCSREVGGDGSPSLALQWSGGRLP